jgi:hypothetical protein
LFVVVFGVLFDAGFQLNHNMFDARKIANYAATKCYKNGRYQPQKHQLSCRQLFEQYKMGLGYFMVIYDATVNHFSHHQLDASEANLLCQNDTIGQHRWHPNTQQPNRIIWTFMNAMQHGFQCDCIAKLVD